MQKSLNKFVGKKANFRFISIPEMLSLSTLHPNQTPPPQKKSQVRWIPKPSPYQMNSAEREGNTFEGNTLNRHQHNVPERTFSLYKP